MRWKDVRIGKKVMTGIGIVLVLLVVIVIWGAIGMTRIADHGVTMGDRAVVKKR
ncbi:hypothetical protein M1N01_01315 [Thermodesulfovibrionales bacterium]|nr:hypothetical protein [Thermodesulfovibrionales bacterium]